ncbi:MAG: ABC transporter ATP-binding protein [Maricaulaceae bacterium]
MSDFGMSNFGMSNLGMSVLRVDNLTVKAGEAALVKDASFTLASGTLCALLGPNGAGKTSLLRGSLGLTSPASGQAFLSDKAVSAISPSRRAQQIAYLPQMRSLAWPNIVRDVVALGRFSHGAPLSRLKGKDKDAVDRAIEACDIGHLASRRADSLSGGELARVHCARAFAAQAPLLIADEPVAALDPRHQFRVMDIIRKFVDDGGGALVVLHDINLAARYADRLIWMKDGEILADGTPEETLTEERLKDIYGIKARVNGETVHIEGAA